MFKSGRWSSKTKFKSVFMLQFQATEVPRSKKSGVSIALVPEDVGKTTLKLEKAPIVDGTCTWEKPIYETVKLIREHKTGKIKEKIYHFIVSTGSSKSGFLGEASIDFADFAHATEPLTVSLPLKFANSGAVLHVTIMKMEGPEDQRDVEENEAVPVEHESNLKHQLSNYSSDGNYDFTDEGLLDKSISEMTGNATLRPSSTLSEQNLTRKKRSNTDWSVGSVSDGSLVDSSNSLEDNNAREVSDDSTEKLKGEIAILMRQASVSELELQTLRRQVVKETKRGQTLSSEIVSLKDERNLLKNELQGESQLKSENQDLKDLLEEIKKELDHEEDVNANLRLKLQKSQDSNSELILEIRELNKMLEQKNTEMNCISRKNREVTNYKCDKNKDEYKEHDDNEEIESLKQKITDLSGEIDVYRKHKDNLAIYVEQLTVENEILKQENHKTKQHDDHEPLQSECSGPVAIQRELESQVERLEEQIQRQAQQLSESTLAINELESEVKELEKELEKQAQRFEDELDNTTRAKLQQEQRAIRAEDALRKARWNSTATAEKLQDEIKKISTEMNFKLDESEMLTEKALAESTELHQQKRILEEMLHKANEELGRIKDHNDQMSLELDDKAKQLEYAKEREQEKHEAYSKEIQSLRTEIQRRGETEENKTSTSETELLTQRFNKEKDDLDKKFASARMEAEKLTEELIILRSNKDENESLIRKLQSEKQNNRTQYSRLKDELQKKESEIARIEKKLKDNNMQSTASEASMTSLQKKLRLMEEQVKLKEAALETARSSYLKKETNLSNTIKKLENKLEQLKCSQRLPSDAITKEARCVGSATDNTGKRLLHSEKSATTGISTHDEREVQQKVSTTAHCNDERNISELVAELTLLKKHNKSMESDLRDMQERYTEISLRFAEVEGERQQLVMTVRNLKNGKKN